MANEYCTLLELRARVGAISGNTDQDAVLGDCIEAASRAIDNYTHRRFYKDSDTATKYYTADYVDVLFINDDIVSIGTLSTDNDGDRTYENTWETTDFDLLPFNSSIKTMIEVTPNGSYNFPHVRKGVKVEGIFGIDGAPADVKEACLILAQRLFKRKDTPFGIAGVTDLGEVVMLPEDADVKALLKPYRRLV